MKKINIDLQEIKNSLIQFYLPALGILVLLLVVSLKFQIPISRFTRDPSAILIWN